MPSNRLEEIRERVDKEMMRCQTHRYVKANEPGYGKEPVCQDIPYLLRRLELAEAVVRAGRTTRDEMGERNLDYERNIMLAITRYDAFLSASNPEAGGGK